MTLVDIITARESKFSDLDDTWKQFVVDHKSEIRATSTEHNVSPDLMNDVKYDLDRYLRYIRIPTYYAWLVRLINEFHNDIEFIKLQRIYVPDPSYITSLYDKYMSVKANAK